MIKSKYLLLFIFVTTLFISSCNNDLDDNSTENVESNTLTFTYNGINYSSICKTIQDSIIIYDDNVKRLFLELRELPNLATYIHPDGTIEYFDNPEKVEQYIKITNGSFPLTKSIYYQVITDVRLTIYKDNKHSGESLNFNLVNGRIPKQAYADLTTIGWDKMISSIVLHCDYVNKDLNDPNPTLPSIRYPGKCIATFFSEKDFEGYSLWFAVDAAYTDSHIDYFKSYRLFPGSSKNWNDATRSFIFKFSGYNN